MNPRGEIDLDRRIRAVIQGMHRMELAVVLKPDVDAILSGALLLSAGDDLRMRGLRVADAFGHYCRARESTSWIELM